MDNFFAKNIKYLRKINKLDQAEFGKLFDRSIDCISTWERGIREPKTIDALRICEMYNLSLNDLINTDLSNTNDAIVLSADEIDLIKDYRRLTDSQKQAVKNMIGAF